MKEMQIFCALGHVDDRFIEEMYGTNAMQTENLNRQSIKKIWVIAAVISILVFLLGCAVFYVLSMENLWITHSSGNQQVLTVAGVKGTASYKAAAAWYEFKQTYDPELQVYHEVISGGKIPQFSDTYAGYSLYTQEMKAALDAIMKQYGLSPKGAYLHFRTVQNMCDALGIEKIQTGYETVTVKVIAGGCYESGCFHLSMEFELEDAGQSEPKYTTGILRWNRKDCFSEDILVLESAGNWKEWNYITASGYQTLMIRSDTVSRGWIICDRGDAILTVEIETILEYWHQTDGETWAEKEYLTDAQMEQIADAIDFGIQPRIATREDAENQPPVPDDATQNGYTVEMKSVVTDGTVAHITLGITAPEGTMIEITDVANFDILTPIAGKGSGGKITLKTMEDGDGLAHTQDLIVEAEMSMADGSNPFAVGSVWILRLVDLNCVYYDTDSNTVVEELVAEGEWLFRFAIDETNGNQEQIQFISEPVFTKTVAGYKSDGTAVYQDVAVTSFVLHSMGATVLCDCEFVPQLADYNNPIMVVMNDDSTIRLSFSSGMMGMLHLKAETPIDMTQVDHILLADGTKLMMP